MGMNYEADIQSSSSDSPPSMSYLDSQSPGESGKPRSAGGKESKAKIKRYRPSWQQRILLEQIFEKNPYPDLAVRTQLSQQLGITPRKVQIWFQNRRTKEKNSEQENRHLLTITESIPEPQEDSSVTLLVSAAAAGHSCVPHLISKGSNCNATTKLGWTALYAACTNNKEQTVAQLLSKPIQCNVNTLERINGQSPLHVSAMKGYEPITWLLLTKGFGIEVNIRDYQNRTPLHHACMFGHIAIVKQLLHCNADLHVVSVEGYTPLHCAALMGHLEIVNILIDRGADINCRDMYDFTPLAFAVREQKEDLVKLLHYHGADINAKTNENLTPLHIACCRRNFAILRFLVEAGSDLWAASVHGYTPIKLAELHQNFMFISYLFDQMKLQSSRYQQHSQEAQHTQGNPVMVPMAATATVKSGQGDVYRG